MRAVALTVCLLALVAVVSSASLLKKHKKQNQLFHGGDVPAPKTLPPMMHIRFEYNKPSSANSPVDQSNVNVADLKAVAQVLHDYPNVRFYLEAHASQSGTDNHNWGLSQRRGEFVLHWLTAVGLSDCERLLTPGSVEGCREATWGVLVCGETHANEVENPMDRRVTVR